MKPWHRVVPRRSAVIAAVVTLLATVLHAPAAQASPAVQYTNPLVAQRADPHIYKHTDGYYYFTATVPEYDRIVLRRATTLQGLATRAGDGDLAQAHQRRAWAPTSGRRRSTSSTASGTSTSPPARPTTSGRSGCTSWRAPAPTR